MHGPRRQPLRVDHDSLLIVSSDTSQLNQPTPKRIAQWPAPPACHCGPSKVSERPTVRSPRRPVPPRAAGAPLSCSTRLAKFNPDPRVSCWRSRRATCLRTLVDVVGWSGAGYVLVPITLVGVASWMARGRPMELRPSWRPRQDWPTMGSGLARCRDNGWLTRIVPAPGQRFRLALGQEFPWQPRRPLSRGTSSWRRQGQEP